jgi:hypothetical protein
MGEWSRKVNQGLKTLMRDGRVTKLTTAFIKIREILINLKSFYIHLFSINMDNLAKSRNEN